MRTLLAIALLASAQGATLFQQPTISRTQVVFAYGGDLWIAPRDGGEARRLTVGIGTESDPFFSPDGAQIAFTGEYDGNIDVYVVPLTGGMPRRLTWHPGPDRVAGWTPDGKQILFRSSRNSHNFVNRLFTLAPDGTFPAELPLPTAEEGAFSTDGSRLAYVPLGRAFDAWKRYRGGRTTPVWIANLSDSLIEKIPRDNSNDFNPMWAGNRIYFLSDRNGPVTLFSYDTATKKVAQAIPNNGFDIKSASAGPDAIAYEQFGTLLLYDLKTGKARQLDIRLAGDLMALRPTYEKVVRSIRSGGLSPTGARALFEARGEVLTVPAEKGDIRNLTNTPGVAERYPAWAPNGRRIAYFSDESGEYALHIRDQSGMGDVRKIPLGEPGFFFSPVWSPDSNKVAYTDHRLQLWYLDLEKGTPVRVDARTFNDPGRDLNPCWSPDSRWLAYTKGLRNHLRAVFVYSTQTGRSHQLTDGMSDGGNAVFDMDGKHLYFTASTDAGVTSGWLDMTSYDRPVSRSVYVIVLRKDLPSPIAPESDEEKDPDAAAKEKEKAADTKKEPEPVRIDVENVGQRILALSIPARNYIRLVAGKSGILYLAEVPHTPIGMGPSGPPGAGPNLIVHKYELKTRKVERAVEGVQVFDLSQNGEKMLYRRGDQWIISSTSQPPKPGEGVLKLDAMEVRVEPKAEWKQMYREVWRIQRDFFYDPGAHGLDLKAAEKKYEPYLDAAGSRGDLNYLFREMLGEMSVGHMGAGGGATPEVKRVPVGLLGADLKLDNGRYRLARVFDGENWNPQLRAPLTQPGVNVAAGEYLLAVNGRELRASHNVFSFFEGTADKSVVVRVGPNPDGSGSREVTVVPVPSESGLRNLAWIEENRRKVDKMTGGRVAYVYLPNTASGGYINFNRYYFAQLDKDAAVIDERFNGGGSAADYIVDMMRRPLMNYFHTRHGEDFTTPVGSIFGPKVMIINEYAGSGGDLMPWMFRKSGIGKLVGKRTWGGLVGHVGGRPPLIDGGFVASPNLAFWNPDGAWDVENRGVAPDVEVEFDPFLWRQGRDPQLEKAVELILADLKKNPPPKHKRPVYPNYHKTSNSRSIVATVP
jgi:tricorn protease